MKKCVIKQAFIRAAKDLEGIVKPILNLYANRVDDFVDNLDNNEMKKDILFHLNNRIYFCQQSEINCI